MYSEDEFDTIPDEFEGIDFDAVPALTALPAALSEESATASDSDAAIPPRPPSAGSTHYSWDDEIDESVLVEVDAIERRIALETGEIVEGACIIL